MFVVVLKSMKSAIRRPLSMYTYAAAYVYPPWLARHCATHAIKRKTTSHVSPGNALNCAPHTFRGGG